MIRKGIIRGIQIALIPVVCGIAGLLLLAAAFLLPTERIASNVRKSVPVLTQETDYFSVTPTVEGTRLDNFTEAIYLNEALVSTKDAGLIQCILSGYQFNPADSTGLQVEKLSKVMAEPEGNRLSAESKRFFNGYETVVKPLLMLTDYSGIRQINLFAGLFLTLWLLYLMMKRGLRAYILPVILSLLFLRPLTLMLNMTFFGFYVCMLVPCILILLSKEEMLRKRAWLLFGMTGAVTYYFNMNYIQLLSFGVPMIFYFLAAGVPEKPFALLKTAAYLFAAWLAGCVGMMVFKWVAYALLIDSNIFSQMKDYFLMRTDVDKGSRLSAVRANLETAFSSTWWNIAEIIFVAATVANRIRHRKKPDFSAPEIILMAVMAALPVGRCLILSNHVINHYWVTYRLMMIPVLAFNIFITKTGQKEKTA